jgi:hypothetical protein
MQMPADKAYVLLTQAVQTVGLEHSTQLDSTEAQVEQVKPFSVEPVLQDVQTVELEQVTQLVMSELQRTQKPEGIAYSELVHEVHCPADTHVTQLGMRVAQLWHDDKKRVTWLPLQLRQTVGFEQVTQLLNRELQVMHVPLELV